MMSNSPTPSLQRGGLDVSPEQAAVVDRVMANPFTVVDAGAGAGKTRTTVATTFEILQTRPEATLDQFVLITFTNKAANELRSKLGAHLRELQSNAETDQERARWLENRERLSSAYVGTIHGFCRQLLQLYGHGAKVARLSDVEFSRGRLNESLNEVLEEHVLPIADHPLKRTSREWRYHRLLDLMRSVYEDCRNRGLDPSKVETATSNQPHTDAGQAYRKALAQALVQVHTIYEGKKKADQKLDSTDLLLFSARVLESSEDGATILERLAEQYRYLFIDEFQDTDPVQKRILDRLKGHMQAVMVVGDGKQSIYEFRGASLSLSEIAKENNVTPLSLTISRRPTEQLLATYNALFQSMANRYPELGHVLHPSEAIFPSTNRIPPLTLLHHTARNDQMGRIRRVAEAITNLVGGKHLLDRKRDKREPVEVGDIVLLFRNNAPLEAYEDALRPLLREAGIEIRHEASQRFYQQPEVIGVYRLLRLLLDYPNDVTLSLALETIYCRKWQLREKEENILWYGRQEGNDLTDTFEREYPEEAQRLADLRSAMRTDTVSELLGRLDETLGLRAYHRQRGDSRGEEILERLREIPRTLSRSEQALTLGLFVQHLTRCIQTNAKGPEEPSVDDEDYRPNYVRLSTIHSAKGLEFPIVILPEVHKPLRGSGSSKFVLDEQEGLDLELRELGNPSTQSPRFRARLRQDKRVALHEEMRVFYVAITRAQNHVILVGADACRMYRPREKEYSWQDEVLKAWKSMEPLGVQFE